MKRLECRGYDSAGIATSHEGALERRRATGKLINLQGLLVREPLRRFVDTGQTRWATHGVISFENTHPHRSGPVAVVHNDIIKNFRELRDKLIAAGARFTSETDTETTVHLANKYLADDMPPVAAAHASLKGALALGFLFEGEEVLLFAAHRGSPL